MEFKERFFKFIGAERKEGLEGLSVDLQKELDVISKFVPYLREEDKAANVALFMRGASPETLMTNPMVEQIENEDLRNKSKAADEIKLALLQVAKKAERYVAGFTQPQSARVQEAYQEFAGELSGLTVADLPGRLGQVIERIKSLQNG